MLRKEISLEVMQVTEKIYIENCDNMELMARYPDKYFDLCIIDPPYGIGESNKQRKNAPCKRWKAAKNDIPYEKKEWDKTIPTAEYWKELFRVSKNQIVWGGNYMTEYLPPRMGWIFWDKKNGDTDFSDGEWLWNGFQKQKPEERIHPTQKPVALYAWILKNYAKQGDKILDTHLGSGSIAIAVHEANSIDKMDLSLVACELDKDYFESSIQRVKAALQTQSLF